MAVVKRKTGKQKVKVIKPEAALTQEVVQSQGGLPKWHRAEGEMAEGEKLDPQEEKMLDWILNGVVIFILGWLGLSVLLVIGGYFGLWK